MTGLLVSVRNAAEADAALRGGADIIDVKEPSRGALGAADHATIAGVLQCVGERRPVSAALGELLELEPLANPPLPPGLAYVKIGLAACGAVASWRERWRRIAVAIPRDTRLVAVAYADWRRVEAPPPAQVVEAAAAMGCSAVLVDTCSKDHGWLMHHMTRTQLVAISNETHRRRMQLVLAGSISLKTLPEVLGADADYIGVRGAACGGERTGSVDSDRVAQLVAAIRATFPAFA